MPRRHWSNSLSAKILQVANNGNTKGITSDKAIPQWILRFRKLNCLQDTHGRYHKPEELLRRTPETEPLLDIEAFVRAEYDIEQTRPLLIKLGVQDKPTGPEHLLERLRGLSQVSNAPIFEVQKWYNRLDQMIDNCSTEQLQLIRTYFADKPLILTSDDTWAKASEVFLQSNEEDVPDALTVHPTVNYLSLWHKIGVAVQPTAELAIDWLKSLDSGVKLSPEEIRRVGALLSRYAAIIWDRCGHWLNLDGQWVPTDWLEYKLTMKSLVPWSNLFATFKQKTADCQRLSVDLCTMLPFSKLSNLAEQIEDHLHEGLLDAGLAVEKEWMKALGQGISRIVLSDEIEEKRIRELGLRLSITKWQMTTGLEVIPYIGGTPAGSARKTTVAWKDDIFFVEDCGVAKIFKAIAQELARPFDRREIEDAIKACVERQVEFINEYLEENFKLLPVEEIESTIEPVDKQKQQKVEQIETGQSGVVGQNEEGTVPESEDVTKESIKTESGGDESIAPQDIDETDGDGDCCVARPETQTVVRGVTRSVANVIDGRAQLHRVL